MCSDFHNFQNLIYSFLYSAKEAAYAGGLYPLQYPLQYPYKLVYVDVWGTGPPSDETINDKINKKQKQFLVFIVKIMLLMTAPLRLLDKS